jgi:hypothetical protein
LREVSLPPGSVSTRCTPGHLSLHFLFRFQVLIAAQQGNDSCIQLLSELGADINQTNHGNRSPLYICSKRGHHATVNQLVELGAEVEGAAADAALRVARAHGHHYIFDILIRTRTVKEEARNGEIDSIFNRILRGAIPTPKQWVWLLSSKSHRALSEKITQANSDTRSCYAVLYGPSIIETTFRSSICHDGHPHIQKLVSSFLVPKEAASRKLLREIGNHMRSGRSGCAPRPSEQHIKDIRQKLTTLVTLSTLVNVLVCSLALLMTACLPGSSTVLPDDASRIYEHDCRGAERVPDRFLDEIVVLRGCFSASALPMAGWPLLAPPGEHHIQQRAVKMQAAARGFYYFDKAKPWASALKPQHTLLDQQITLVELWNLFNISGKQLSSETLPVAYATVRLPPAIGQQISSSFSQISSVLPEELSKSFYQSVSSRAPNLWLASPGAFALPHYDLEHNVVMHLQGTKRFWLAPPSSHKCPFAMPLHPSSHPHWRHLVSGRANESLWAHTSKSALGRTAQAVDLLPGDALILPPYYFHATEASVETTASLNVWFGQQELETKLRKIVLPLDHSSHSSDVLIVATELALANWNFGSCALSDYAQDTKSLLSELKRRCDGLAWASKIENIYPPFTLPTEPRPSLLDLKETLKVALSGIIQLLARV